MYLQGFSIKLYFLGCGMISAKIFSPDNRKTTWFFSPRSQTNQQTVSQKLFSTTCCVCECVRHGCMNTKKKCDVAVVAALEKKKSWNVVCAFVLKRVLRTTRNNIIVTYINPCHIMYTPSLFLLFFCIFFSLSQSLVRSCKDQTRKNGNQKETYDFPQSVNFMPLLLIKHTRRLIKIRQKTRFSVKTELRKKIYRFLFQAEQNVTSWACVFRL